MKLVRIYRTIVVEEIIKVPDKELDNQITNDRSLDGQRDYADQVKEKLGADHVEVKKVKHFYTDIKKKSGSKKTEPKNPVVKKKTSKTKSAE